MTLARTSFVPVFTVLGAAADVGDADYGIHVVHEHGAEGAERGLHVDAETAIAVEKSTCVG